MSHLNPEALARLIDEPPTAAESEHLAACAECAAELEAMRAEHDALAALPRILPVPTSWEAMRHRLDRDGLLSGSVRRHGGWMPGIAAALALFLAGAATGVALAGDWSGRDVVVATDARPPADPADAAATDAGRLVHLDTTAGGRSGVGLDAETSQPEPATAPPVKLAAREPATRTTGQSLPAADDQDLPSIHGVPSENPNWAAIARRASGARTADEAARFVRDAEGAYLAAMTRLAELTEAGSPNPAVRLATLDGIVVTTGAALQRAPADPVINGYHLAARAQRDALLRTVSSSPAQDPWY